RLQIWPLHFSALAAAMGSDRMPVDAVLIQVRPALSGKGWNLGLSRDLVLAAARRARVVVAELNPSLPECHGGDVTDLRLTALIQAEHPRSRCLSPPWRKLTTGLPPKCQTVLCCKWGSATFPRRYCWH
ncbi:MAG: hypothetical protein Q7J57_16425, partial [Gemmobacter sp.]|nr:hypothetical protein [Gemmobacter sp.]